ncbi:MAG: cysteine hydrolase [Dehalococcoidia bacterium]|nr:MAG: cysteine hydrolase [Dehalococcoidia bacterium]
MANAVLVLDMLKGFLEEGYPLYCGEQARRIIPRIGKLLQQELDKGSKVFFVCDRHAPDDLEFKMFPPHCVSGTEEAEIIPELRDYPGEVIAKNRYSGFYNTVLDERLQAIRPEKLIVCGVCTDICVMYTVADARNRDYEVEVPTDCVASFNDDSHRFALDHMDKVLGAKLVRLE